LLEHGLDPMPSTEPATSASASPGEASVTESEQPSAAAIDESNLSAAPEESERSTA
ncbi:MAG: hypothetical protein JWM99_467, partial [Verrucomicrobiales bacterium]|nr:hypothetical protein [Verrucomicrobiales bacterium]